MLKIHPNQVIRRSMEVLTPEPRTPESCTPESRGRTGFTTSAKDVSIYRSGEKKIKKENFYVYIVHTVHVHACTCTCTCMYVIFMHSCL